MAAAIKDDDKTYVFDLDKVMYAEVKVADQDVEIKSGIDTDRIKKSVQVTGSTIEVVDDFVGLTLIISGSHVIAATNKKIKIPNDSVKRMFYGFQSTGLSLDGVDVSNCETLEEMFYYAQKLRKIGLRNMDASHITSVASMFQNCEALEEVDISGLKTANLADMSRMFKHDPELVKINFGDIDTSKVARMSEFVVDCPKLSELDLSKFSANSLKACDHMIDVGCKVTVNRAFYDKVVKIAGPDAIKCGHLNIVDTPADETTNNAPVTKQAAPTVKSGTPVSDGTLKCKSCYGQIVNGKCICCGKPYQAVTLNNMFD